MNIQRINNKLAFTAKYHPETLAYLDKNDITTRFKLNEIRSSGDSETTVKLARVIKGKTDRAAIFEVTNPNFPTVNVVKTLQENENPLLSIDKKGIEFAEKLMLEKASKYKQYAKTYVEKLKGNLTKHSYKHWLELAKK